MGRKSLKYCFYLPLFILLLSCGKGYEVRVANYYTEPMENVQVGEKIIFEDVPVHGTTEFRKIRRGQYTVTFVTKDKQYFYSSVFIPGQGEGKRTLQIDAAKQISILEE